MGKRSSFERRERDFYPTPYEGVVPLLPHLPERCTYVEPCAGDGALIRALGDAGHECVDAFDIDPKHWNLGNGDARTAILTGGEFVITNPPWARFSLHPIIENLSRQKPTWLLFDADWMHTRQSVPFLPWLKAIVSVGRVKWIPGSPMTGKDNCCWYLFDQNTDALDFPAFYGRTA